MNFIDHLLYVSDIYTIVIKVHIMLNTVCIGIKFDKFGKSSVICQTKTIRLIYSFAKLFIHPLSLNIIAPDFPHLR